MGEVKDILGNLALAFRATPASVFPTYTEFQQAYLSGLAGGQRSNVDLAPEKFRTLQGQKGELGNSFTFQPKPQWLPLFPLGVGFCLGEEAFMFLPQQVLSEKWMDRLEFLRAPKSILQLIPHRITQDGFKLPATIKFAQNGLKVAHRQKEILSLQWETSHLFMDAPQASEGAVSVMSPVLSGNYHKLARAVSMMQAHNLFKTVALDQKTGGQKFNMRL